MGTPAAADARRTVLGILAQAELAELQLGLATLTDAAECELLRSPETGLVMLRGRIGGEGRPFNLGEATVTRAAVRLASGEVGFCYALGRDKEKARLAALADALWQKSATREAIERDLLRPLEARLAAAAATQAAQAAATKVEFFTMTRGED